MPGRALGHGVHHQLAGDARHRLLAGGVDLGDDHLVGRRQGRTELVRRGRRCASSRWGWKHATTRRRAPGCGRRRSPPRPRSGGGRSRRRSATPCERPRSSKRRPAPSNSASAAAASAGSAPDGAKRGDRAGRVQRVVRAGHRQRHMQRRRRRDREPEARCPSGRRLEPGTCQSALLGQPEPLHRAARGQLDTVAERPRRRRRDMRRPSPRRRAAHVGQRAEAGVVVEVEVGDHGDPRAQERAAAVRLVGLGHQQVARPGPAFPPSWGTSPPIR